MHNVQMCTLFVGHGIYCDESYLWFSYNYWCFISPCGNIYIKCGMQSNCTSGAYGIILHSLVLFTDFNPAWLIILSVCRVLALMCCDVMHQVHRNVAIFVFGESLQLWLITFITVVMDQMQTMWIVVRCKLAKCKS